MVSIANSAGLFHFPTKNPEVGNQQIYVNCLNMFLWILKIERSRLGLGLTHSKFSIYQGYLHLKDEVMCFQNFIRP